jgi:quercetin dioxygenase-like cupin family protein
MQYRTHEDGPLTEISIEPGAVVVTMTFDRPGDYTQLHSHAFDHEMQCIKGAARIVIDDVQTVLNEGGSYMVEAHKRHGVWPLASGTVLRCVHAHEDIHPDMKPEDGVPIEWLHRLTDEVPFDARG